MKWERRTGETEADALGGEKEDDGREGREGIMEVEIHYSENVRGIRGRRPRGREHAEGFQRSFHTCAYLTRIASLIENLPGFRGTPHIFLPRLTTRSLAKRCPRG